MSYYTDMSVLNVWFEEREETNQILHIKPYIQNKIGHVHTFWHKIEFRNTKMQNLKRVLEIRHDENGRHNKSTLLDYMSSSSSVLQRWVGLDLLLEYVQYY